MLLMLMLFIMCFLLSHDASPPVVSMDILNSSTSKLVISVKFSEAPSLSTLTRLCGCFSFFDVVRMKWIMHTDARLGAVGNTHIILVFAHTTVIIEVNSQMGVAL